MEKHLWQGPQTLQGIIDMFVLGLYFFVFFVMRLIGLQASLVQNLVQTKQSSMGLSWGDLKPLKSMNQLDKKNREKKGKREEGKEESGRSILQRD